MWEVSERVGDKELSSNVDIIICFFQIRTQISNGLCLYRRNVSQIVSVITDHIVMCTLTIIGILKKSRGYFLCVCRLPNRTSEDHIGQLSAFVGQDIHYICT